MTAHGRIDPLPDQSARCVHDMLNGQCSWCRGLPDVPDTSAPASEDFDELRPTRWLPVEGYTECAACGSPIRPGQQAAWSWAHSGNVGRCCEELVA